MIAIAPVPGGGGDAVVVECFVQHGDQIVCLVDPLADRAEAFGVLDKIGIVEMDVDVMAQFPVHVPFDQSVVLIDPDEDDKV